MSFNLIDLEARLRDSPHEWRWHAASVINAIPRGHLASYGAIARGANKRAGLNLRARNIAWLRSHLYEITDRDTSLPLHRIAKIGDREFESDSDYTRKTSKAVRQREGLYANPPWWDPS